MDFKNVVIDKITLNDSVKSSFDIRYNDKPLYIYSPKLYIPFGIENYKNSYSLSLQLRNIDNYENLKKFSEFIQELEKHFIELLDISEDELTSQIKLNIDNKYDPILYTKFISKYNKVEAEVKNYNNEPMNIFDIEKNNYCKCLLYLDKVWKFNSYTYKIKIKEIKIL